MLKILKGAEKNVTQFLTVVIIQLLPDNFKGLLFYVTSKKINSNYSTEIFQNVTVFNFFGKLFDDFGFSQFLIAS